MAKIVAAMKFDDGRPMKELGELSVWEWVGVLRTNPEFIDRVDMGNFEGWDFCVLLSYHPEAIEKAHFLMSYFERMSDYDWARLLDKQPQLAKYRPKRA